MFPPQLQTQPQRNGNPINEDFLDFLDEYVASADMQDALLDALMTAPKKLPRFLSSSSQAPCILEARRHLTAIFRSRGPVSDDDIANPTMSAVIAGPMSESVWSLVYELVDLEKGIGDQMERERLKYDLVEALVMCIRWQAGLDVQWEAEKLVEDMFPLRPD